MKKRPVETIMGIVVLLVAAFFLFFAYRVSDLQVVRGYELNARFLNYDAEVKLSIAPNVKLPKDSAAVIASNGLMGNKFIKIEPGKSEELLQNGDEITNTKDFKTLEDLVGEVIFMVTGNDKQN